MAAGDGLISMTPTSIAFSGTSASINADGGVDFSAVTSLSLNGVFTGDYDNYLLVVLGVNSSSQELLQARLRVSGSDETGSNYTRQSLVASATSVLGARSTGTYLNFGVIDNQQRSGNTVHIYGPFLAQPTSTRNINIQGEGNGEIIDFACTHSLSTSYDGLTLVPGSYNITGNVHVFGYEE